MRSRWQVQTRNLPAFGMSRPDFWIKSEFFSALGGFPSPTMPCYRRALVCQTSAEDLVERAFKLEMTKQSCSCKFSNCPPTVTFVCNCVIIEFCSLFIISNPNMMSFQLDRITTLFSEHVAPSIVKKVSVAPRVTPQTLDNREHKAQSFRVSKYLSSEYHLTHGQCRTDTF